MYCLAFQTSTLFQCTNGSTFQDGFVRHGQRAAEQRPEDFIKIYSFSEIIVRILLTTLTWNKKGFDSDTRVVDLLLCKTRINDENDTVDSQGSFGNVGRDDDLATYGSIRLVWRWRLENSLLLLGWQCWVEGDDFHIADFGTHFFNFVSNSFTRVFNLLLTSQEQQTIALLLFAQVNLYNSSKTISYELKIFQLPNSGFEVVLFWLWGVENFDGESTTRNGHERCIVEVRLKLSGVQRGRHDYNLQIRSLTADLFDYTKQNISSQCTFVSLIEKNDIVLYSGWLCCTSWLKVSP